MTEKNTVYNTINNGHFIIYFKTLKGLLKGEFQVQTDNKYVDEFPKGAIKPLKTAMCAQEESEDV